MQEALSNGRKHVKRTLITGIAALGFLAACGSAGGRAATAPAHTATPTSIATAVATPVPTAVSTLQLPPGAYGFQADSAAGEYAEVVSADRAQGMAAGAWVAAAIPSTALIDCTIRGGGYMIVLIDSPSDTAAVSVAADLCLGVGGVTPKY